MENKAIFTYTLMLIVGLLVGYVVGSGSANPDRDGMGMMYGDNNQSNENADRIFIEQMIPHHEGAIAMAELAATKAKTSEIKSLAKDVIEAQTREINDMKSWYKTWYGTDVPVRSAGGGMMMGHNGMHMESFAGDLDELAQAKNFDLEFVNQMIPHHEMAIMMAQMMLGGTERKELKDLADQIVTSQTREIQMMQGWQKTWR
jgi:uncharacterized protein (DUF305 family)